MEWCSIRNTTLLPQDARTFDRHTQVSERSSYTNGLTIALLRILLRRQSIQMAKDLGSRRLVIRNDQTAQVSSGSDHHKRLIRPRTHSYHQVTHSEPTVSGFWEFVRAHFWPYRRVFRRPTCHFAAIFCSF
jgi:hypothetical protein